MNKTISYDAVDGTIAATLTITDDDGTVETFTESVTPDELSAFGATLERDPAANAVAGVRLRRASEIGVDAPGAADWWWNAVSARALGFDPADKSARALAAKDKWWNKDKDGNQREYDRAMYLGVKNWKLLDQPALAIARLKEVGKRGRERIHHRYRRGPWDAGRVTKDVGKVAMDVAPIVATFIPAIGPIVGPALMVVKQLAAAKVFTKGGASRAARGIIKEANEMKATGTLLAADVANNAGAPASALKLLKRAKAQASGPALKAADVTRGKVVDVAQRPDIKMLAKAGRVQSSKGGKVTLSDLKRAAGEGRVFYVG